MRYRDLVEFDPIESVIQLRMANEKDVAARLVDTYVISQRMADQLENIVIPQLRLDSPIDHKGVLVVGNYGTGKSHLMSAISALAEHADFLPHVRNADVRAAAEGIAGKFLVARGEIGGVTQSLRDIVLTDLERFFSRVGTPYTFPPDSQVSNNKDPLIEALAGFSAKYPQHGVLYVLDELLDYLRSREERELILDLGFLRELGELTEVTPFRFIAGVQETLFDNPRFVFVAEQLRRVRDRFEQIRIAREDIAYVVAQRLLRKTDAQLAHINEHLRRFGGLYPQLSDRLAEYAQLFPIHPAYIETFERVYVAEKREVLQTFSRAIVSILDQEVPEQQPGLISYDHYWDVLRGNPSLRTLPGVTEVVQKSDVLLDRVTHAFPRERALLKPMALRIVHALSVHRLTSELDTPLGVTAEELRDQLCLWVRLPEPTADFLADQIRVTLREILRTVNGQYITYNEENGQYYLDLKKDIDFDSNIEERGNFLDERDLNKYFFSALQSLLDIRETSYVTNFRIWEYQLPWPEKKVTRPGYLFLGSPRERSTAQPPRDFYLYFLPPFGQEEERVREGSDEVQFALRDVGPEFEELVRRYAGAKALGQESASNQQIYNAKADTHQRALTDWLQAHFRTHLRVICRGRTYTIAQALALAPRSASADFREQVNVIASALLVSHFAESYPAYPSFTLMSQNFTEAGRKTAAKDAIFFIARNTRTAQAIAALVGLSLLDEQEHIRPEKSPYAQYFLGLLAERAADQVVNHGEVLTLEANGPVPVFDLIGWNRNLTQLRQQYIEAYTQLHQQAVLGPQETTRQKRLKNDMRYMRLATLAQIDKMDAPELHAWERAVAAIPACAEFHTQLLDSAPICPSCRFQPTQVARQGSAASRLGQLEAELDLMLTHWEEALRSTLHSETARESLSRMTIAEQQPIEQYLAAKDATLSDDFVQIANRALRGIQKVSLNVDDLLEALSVGGFPCTEDDLRKRFEAFLRAKMRGYDARNTRLSIERTGDTQSDMQSTAVTAQVSGGNA